MGAWIETGLTTSYLVSRKGSHPMWVRGLKRLVLFVLVIYVVSHPMWVRGLKRLLTKIILLTKSVAPHVGAWIET